MAVVYLGQEFVYRIALSEKSQNDGFRIPGPRVCVSDCTFSLLKNRKRMAVVYLGQEFFHRIYTFSLLKNREMMAFVVVVVVLTLTRIIKNVVTGQAPVTLELRNTPGKNTNQRWFTHISQLTQFMSSPETYKSGIGSQPTMCQVHIGASHYSRLENRLYRLPPKKKYHVYIACSTYYYAYARQTQINWKKRNKEKMDGWRCRSLCALLCSFARCSAALRHSVSCQFGMNNSAPSSTRRNHLPAFGAAFHHPSNFIPKTDISSFKMSYPVLLLTP